MVGDSVSEYRLRLGRFKAGMCDAAWCAPCTWAPLWWPCLLRGAVTNVWPLPLIKWTSTIVQLEADDDTWDSDTFHGLPECGSVDWVKGRNQTGTENNETNKQPSANVCISEQKWRTQKQNTSREKKQWIHLRAYYNWALHLAGRNGFHFLFNTYNTKKIFIFHLAGCCPNEISNYPKNCFALLRRVEPTSQTRTPM